MSRVLLRELHRRSEFEAVQEVARLVWGFEDRQLPSTADLQAAGHVGGLTVGAFDGGEMVGFVSGLPRTNLSRACHHSHMLGVRREWRGRGIATRLKFFQRAWCLERGIRLMTWTYDPLILKNARLNLVQLRARGSRYLANLYGPLGGLYGTLPSDRFEVLWRLDAPEVVRAARGIVPEVSGARELPRATPRRLPRTRRVAVEVPPGAPEFYATDAAAASRARFRLRRVATRLFALGFEATAIDISHQPALYVFERS